ncbi:MAG: hypothetical protein CR977_01020 [Gammaproteobacteria bacterium]|nr:MAG: hypothetical protein CR977_01020 [Gammaproteobacteria bacterium]
MKKALFIFLLCPLLAFAQQGWQATTQANTVIYVPTDLPSDKQFQLTFYRTNLDGMDKKTWLAQHVQAQQSALGKATKKWKIKPEEQGEWGASNAYTPVSGGKLSITYATGTLTNGDSYVYQMIASPDVGLLIKYGVKLNELKPYAEEQLMALQVPTSVATTTKTPSKPEAPTTTPSTTSQSDNETTHKGLVSASAFKKMTGKQRRQYVHKQIRTRPNQGLDLSDVETVLVDVRFNVNRGSVTSDTYLLLEDGTAYTNCETPIRDLNVEVSKKLEGSAYSQTPKWTRWKKKGGKYYIQNTKSKKWELLEDVEKALPGKKGQRLNNTFWTFSGSHFFGPQTSHKGYYKFKSDGRFEISSSTMRGGDMGGTGPYVATVSESDKKGSRGTTVVSGGNIGGGVNSRRNDGNKNTGTYHIDGYTIEFHHDNGWVHRELFHFPKEHKKEYIHIEDEVYWIKDK